MRQKALLTVLGLVVGLFIGHSLTREMPPLPATSGDPWDLIREHKFDAPEHIATEQDRQEEQRKQAERDGDLPPRRNLNNEPYTPQKSKAQEDFERGVQENMAIWKGEQPQSSNDVERRLERGRKTGVWEEGDYGNWILMDGVWRHRTQY